MKNPRSARASRGAALFALCLVTGLATATPAFAAAEEQLLIKVSKMLKPIDDSHWHEIAGSKIKDTYEVVKGDTLWDISKRLFGNAFYWPKVWSLNAGITNPHVIEPGQKLVFMSGTSESLPRLSPEHTPSPGGDVEKSAPLAMNEGSSSSDATPSGPREYDKIPKGKWVTVPPIPEERKAYDELGFEKDLKILTLPSRFTFRVPAIANDTTIPYLGEIVATRRDGVGIAADDTVFLKSNSQDLQVGSTYTIFTEPEYVKEKKSDRGAYLYYSYGEVKIIGVRDELYVGVVSGEYDVVSRGMKVYPLLPLVNDIKPLPARTATESLVMVSKAASLAATSQFHIVHFDRGIEDGVQVGNVFRIYDYFDPITKLKITDSDFLVSADALIIHSTAQFSTALIINGHDTVTHGNFGVLMTDVSDVQKTKETRVHELGRESVGEAPEDKELDELDDLDKASGEGLGRKEESEIKELDQWDKSKDLKSEPEPTVPSGAETPTDEMEQPPTEPTPERKGLPQEPSLDQTLDTPAVTPPGLETPAPPAHLKPAPEQTLEAPPPPAPDTGSMPGEPTPGPNVEPITPPEAGSIEPAVPSPPDDQRSQ